MSAKRGPITCHILDSSRGKPANNVKVKLEFKEFQDKENWTIIGETESDNDGRCQNLVSSDYKITFNGDNESAIYPSENISSKLAFFILWYNMLIKIFKNIHPLYVEA
ncbi:12419_t:CDS:2 [Entrophospora sp. SA101]|nr:15499_t:CDS:2 [Entrophospora sp. SA101]CAJ0906218.1 12419_t:CDS:2 [Entrophospora sp. SA101]